MKRNDPAIPVNPPGRDDEMRARGDDQLRGRAEVEPPPPAFSRGEEPHREMRPPDPGSNVPATAATGGRPMLFRPDESSGLRSRWGDIQAAFVDEPREAVRQADALVHDVTRRVTEVFASERSALEKQWDRGDQVTTEDLRVALQRYRAFFDHLLSF